MKTPREALQEITDNMRSRASEAAHHVFTPAQIERLKREAKALKKEKGIAHTQALDEVARKYGYADYWTLNRASTKEGA